MRTSSNTPSLSYVPVALATACFVFASLSQPSLRAEDEACPNIIWLMAEDMGTDLECYGTAGVKTPHLDRLAQDGQLYSRAYSVNPICSPNRSAMMVGAEPALFNAQHNRSNRTLPLPAPYRPITALLREAGYTCILGHEVLLSGGRKLDCNFKHEAKGSWDGESQFGLFDKFDSITAADQPFFAQVELKVTHRGDWWDRVSAESSHPVDPDSVELPPYLADHPIVREDWARYLDQVEYMDNEVGAILADLEAKGLAENTVVIFIGDNGRCNLRGKGYLYEDGLKVPLIVRWPDGLQEGRVVDDLVSVVDISASILDLAGIEPPAYLTGKPFIGKDDFKREFVVSTRDRWDDTLERSRSVTTKRYKYIRNGTPSVPWDNQHTYLEFYRPALHVMRELNARGELTALQSRYFQSVRPLEELYDLEEDPFETRNLAGSLTEQGALREHRRVLDLWESSLPEATAGNFVFENYLGADVYHWVRYTKPELYKAMLAGEEIGFQRLAREYRGLGKGE